MLAPVGADGANGLGTLVVGLGDVRQLVGLAAEQSLDLLGGVAGDDGQHKRDVVASLEHGPPGSGPAPRSRSFTRRTGTGPIPVCIRRSGPSPCRTTRSRPSGSRMSFIVTRN